eukprot:TRINITY_DN3847_c0_g1_i1.p1 TRINITY_DN3847_c0_g1~~TRINITY_DN3847_c0_g1_i1.p1  ORF type:complete len:341 (-),score=96.26 TRINITY_DN3847_c0_g1_i1:124-1146(-)
MKIKIKTLTGKMYILQNLQEEAPIEKVKEFLHKKSGFPLHGQQLVYKGKVLQPTTLKEAGVKDGDFLVLMVPKPKTPKTPSTPLFVDKKSEKHNEKGEKEKDVEKKTTTSTTTTTTSTSSKISSPEQTPPPPSVFYHSIGSLIQKLMGHDNSQNESAANNAPQALPTVDPLYLQQLVDMGFQAERSKKALILNRMNTQAAMEWLLEHNEDPDIDEPLTVESLQVSSAPDPLLLKQLTDMGFSGEDATNALKACGNNHQEACAWLLGEREENSSGGLDENNPILRSILSDPSIQAGLANPRVLQAVQSILANPSSASQFLNDPEIAPVLLQVHNVINESEW